MLDRVGLAGFGRAYGLRGPSLAWQVMIPASLPSLLTGMRLGMAQGWLFLVAAELIAAQKGLRFLLIDSTNTGRVDITVLTIILLALLGKTSDTVLQIAERRLLRWTDTIRGGALGNAGGDRGVQISAGPRATTTRITPGRNRTSIVSPSAIIGRSNVPSAS